MVDPKFMIDIEKKTHNRSGIFPYSIQKKMHGRTEKKKFRDRSRKNCMVDPEKNPCRSSLELYVIPDSAIPSTFPLTLPGQAKWFT